MAWTSLSTRFGESTPLVLAGPMLRKVTPRSVTVWLALKASAKVTLSIHSSDESNAPSLFSGTADTVRIGQYLHIVAVTARCEDKPPLQPGTVYFYDLSFVSGGKTRDLLQAVDTTDPSILTYGVCRLPGFSLPPDNINQVRLIQGSCRKPHAPGPDALAMLDDLIQASFDDPMGRPHQLILGGDQIYADEVHESLLYMLSDASVLLLGEAESLPTAKGEVFAELVLPANRKPLLDEAKFTSDDKRSHLLSLGEYLAMYLFVWSDVLWPRIGSGIPTVTDLVMASTRAGLSPEPIVSLKDDIEAKRQRLVNFAGSVWKVRRALANVPTCMICDDHEMTDDWNMTREFCENVYGNPLGTRIIRNGLAAYALCQHWGNAPEQFTTSAALPFNPPAGVEFLRLFGIADTNQKAFDDGLKIALGIHTPAEMAARTPFAVYHDEGVRAQTPDGWLDAKSLLFHYTIEATAYQVVITDTRTWRSFPRPGKVEPPDLIAQSQLAFQIGSTPKLKGRVLLVLFTTNFPPVAGIRQATRDLPQISDDMVYGHDLYDSWELERVDFGRALAELSRKFDVDASNVHAGSLVALSGDVHSSFASTLHYRALAQVGDAAGAATKADLVVAQLVASALHNQSEPTVGQHKRGYKYVPSAGAYFAAQQVQLKEDLIGWNPVTRAEGTVVARHTIHSFNNPDIDGFPLKFEADKSIITTRFENMGSIWSNSLDSVEVPPDFRIHLEYLKADVGGSYDREPLVSSGGLHLVNASARAYERYVRLARSGQYIVGLNNIGEIGFTYDPNFPSRQVHYTVHWFEDKAKRLVRYDISLDPRNDIAKYPGEP